MRIFTSQPSIVFRESNYRASKRQEERVKATQRATTTKMHHDTRPRSPCSRSGRPLPRLYSSSSSMPPTRRRRRRRRSTAVFAKGMLVGSASTLRCRIERVRRVQKNHTTVAGRLGRIGRKERKKKVRGGPLPEGEFGEKESLMG